MHRRVLDEHRFRGPRDGWAWPSETPPAFQTTTGGTVLSPLPGKRISLHGPGVHTRHGDSIELHFEILEHGSGALRFGFAGGKEHVIATLDFRKARISVHTSDWSGPQPAASAPLPVRERDSHVLLIAKTETSGGGLIRNADVRIALDGAEVLTTRDLNVLPEMGVTVEVAGMCVLLRRFVHRGRPSGIPEYLHIGGWQMLNRRSLADNLDSIRRGLRLAAEAGVELLVTPETSLTGMPPARAITAASACIPKALAKLRRFMRTLKNAPHLVVGLPLWHGVPGHRRRTARYNGAHVYAPDGTLVASCAKVHECEDGFWHGHQLNEFDVGGVPMCLQVCHDGRYPDVSVLPVMFGARLVVHVANTHGQIKRSIDAFEAWAAGTVGATHAFCIYVNGAGGSCIAGPGTKRLLAVSAECRRDVPSFPMMDKPQESLFHARIRVHDSFGYWPMRAFRASEQIAEAHTALYRAMGGSRRGVSC